MQPSFAECYAHHGNVERRILDVIVRYFAGVFGAVPLDSAATLRFYTQALDADGQRFAEDAARRMGDGVSVYGVWRQDEDRPMPPEAYAEAIDGTNYCAKDLQNGHNSEHMRQAAHHFIEAGKHLMAEMRERERASACDLDRDTVPCIDRCECEMEW